ncbi:hypothetical protein NDN11_17775 [Acinetobacter sp. C26M]|uniref:ABZJ_00068 family colistin stress protein n=1 Tax=unclassified Acinetobacter TaxID=196816 RepID=UPI0020366A5F|nr:MULTISPECIES: hypothetical protein [unclassified Acinetobacter]USA46499.1 hypothetical protein NDN11_17775 [Acinetobacter sp. C26M]USA49983.1 hypothetical protein NDN12_17690 [Acinetobacter sp. C26G]
MLQVFLVLLTAVTFVLMAADPRPTDSTEAESAWQVETTQLNGVEALVEQKPVKQEKDFDQA